MSYADQIRRFCEKHYIEPARTKGMKAIEKTSGDVHQAMNFVNRYPLVCSSIKASKFEELCNVRLIAVEGPSQSAKTIFRFEIL